MYPGNKIELHGLEPDHLKKANEWVNNPGINKFLTLYQPVPLRATKQWYESLVKNANEHVFAILTKRGAHIGNCGLHAIDWKNSNAMLGIVIGEPRYQSRGFGEDTVITLTRVAFLELNLHRVYLHVWAFNARAIRCYEKCGFTKEGIMRDMLFRDGTFHDVLCMGILSKEFKLLEAAACPRKK